MTTPREVAGEARARVTEVLDGLPPEQAETRVPTCPEWRVKDVVAHVTGVCADVLAGNIEGVATEPWTAAQVDARRDRSLAEILEEWAEVAPPVEEMSQYFPGRVGIQWSMDVVTHEHDIRCALDRPGARDSSGVDLGLELLVLGLHGALANRGLGPVEVSTGRQTWLVGGGDGVEGDEAAVIRQVEEDLGAVLLGADPENLPEGEAVAALKVDGFDLLRALTGRRSRAQIGAFDWSVDPEPYLPAFQFGPFTTAATHVPE